MADGRLWAAYDGMGDRYRRHAEDSAYNAHYDRPAVLAALGPVAGLTVLDAACGPGLYAADLAAAGAEVAGFDASREMVELARARSGRPAAYRQAVLGEVLPYSDGQFDAAICALAIHYVADLRAAFAELHRVLRPGGVLVVSTQHPTTDWLRKGGSYFETVLESDDWGTPEGPTTMRFWRVPLSALCDAAADAGWLIERLIEPRPAESMRERFPDTYAKLQVEPGFLILKLRKPANPQSDPAHDPKDEA